MKELVIIVWAFFAFALSFSLMYVLKKQQRKMGKYTMIANLILVILTFGLSYLVFRFLNESSHLIWITRLTLVSLGSLFLWFVYSRPWTIRHHTNYSKDAFAPEFMFLFFTGILVCIAFIAAPQVFEIIPYPVDLSVQFWEAPIYFILPFLVVKLFDFSGQIPFRTVENPWVFPLEPVQVETWPWRDLIDRKSVV